MIMFYIYLFNQTRWRYVMEKKIKKVEAKEKVVLKDDKKDKKMCKMDMGCKSKKK